jgi:tRNA pseudouridine38-40 synthase
MKRIRLIVAYDGTNYCGWQVQPNGITIEEVINLSLSKLLGGSIRIIGASRTDSGVHALGNVAVFDTDTRIPPERISYALNQRLPKDIVIVRSDEVPADWHPRYCNCVKTYEYHIFNAQVPDPTKRLTTYFVSYPLNIEDMRRAADHLIGKHDFASFCNIRTNVEDTVRTIYSLEIMEQPASGRAVKLRSGFVGTGFSITWSALSWGRFYVSGGDFIRPGRSEIFWQQKTARRRV